MWDLFFNVSGAPKAMMTKFIYFMSGLYSSVIHSGGGGKCPDVLCIAHCFYLLYVVDLNANLQISMDPGARH